MFTLTKGMGHEKHMVLLVGYVDYGDLFDQVQCHTYSQKGTTKKQVCQNGHGLIK
jgi:hypothetical protein